MASPDELDPAAKPLTPAPVPDDPTYPDPLTGEPGAHPVGVGIGAAGAGVAGAVIGSLMGPVGAAIGAAIGAVAGGLAGKEVAASDDEPAPITHTPATRPTIEEAVLPGTGTLGINEEGIPGIPLAAATGHAIAGSHTDETTGVGAGRFHEAFTATTLRETEEENRLVGDDAPDPDLPADPEADADLMATTASLRADQHLPSGEAVTGGTPLGRANERHEHVSTAAYYRYLSRAGVSDPGDALGDWLSAEREFPAE